MSARLGGSTQQRSGQDPPTSLKSWDWNHTDQSGAFVCEGTTSVNVVLRACDRVHPLGRTREMRRADGAVIRLVIVCVFALRVIHAD